MIVALVRLNLSTNLYAVSGFMYFFNFPFLLFVTLRIISFNGTPTSALALGNRFELAVSVILLAIDLAISFTTTLFPQLSGIKVTFICSFTLTVLESIFRFTFA